MARIAWVLLCVLPLLCLPGKARAQAWRSVEGSQVTPEEAASFYQRAVTLAAPKRASGLSVGAAYPAEITLGLGAAYPAEITQLARGLGHDPLAIYNYVRNNIEFLPYWGLRKGALGCLQDGNGNDFDQADLLIALLRASGFEANFVYGTMVMPTSVMANWFGVEAKLNLVANCLHNNGIPYGVNNGTEIRLNRVWVNVNVEGKDYQLDASYKTYAHFPVVNLASIMGYSREDFLAAVQQGATVTPDYVRNLNDTNLRAKLNQYAMNLANGLRTHYPNAEAAHILGGSEIVQTQISELTRGLHFTATVTEQWESVPVAYMDKFRVQIHGIDHTFQGWELFGKRLTISFAGSPLKPQLRLNGEIIASGSSASAGQQLTGTFSIDHSLVAENGTYTDQSESSSFRVQPSYIYAVILANTLGSSERAIRLAEERRRNAIKEGIVATSETVKGEVLNITGLRFLQQRAQTYLLQAQTSDTKKFYHHAIGIVQGETGIVVNWIGYRVSTIHKKDGLDNRELDASSLVGWATGSGYEHAIMEQLYAGIIPGASSIKVLWKNNQAGGKVFLARSANYSAIQGSLASYSAATRANFQNHVNANGFILLGENGNTQINGWTGAAWIGYGGIDAVDGYRIGGSLNGGIATTADPPEEKTIADWFNDFFNFEAASGLTMEGPASQDPVDLKSGYWFTDTSDLRLGSGRMAAGLNFTRNYTSGSANLDGPLGFGWTHGYDVRVTETSSGTAVSGARSAIDAVAFLVYGHVVSDVFKELVGCPFGGCPQADYTRDVLGHMTLVLGCNWFMEQTVNNIARVTEGPNSREFVRLPDGSYNAPAGVTSRLTKEADGRFKLTERDGTVRRFDQENLLTSVVDVDGNEMTLSYTAGKLTRIQDAYSRTLTLSYTGERITTVADSAGRIVSYGYDAAQDLTRYTDPDGYEWRYVYDQHRLTQIIDPEGSIQVTNVYNDLNQVDRQTLPRQVGLAEYTFLFGDYRSVEIDPSGNRTTYFYDPRGRTVAIQDALGNSVHMAYDGQNHEISRTDGRGNRTRMEYDGRHNLVKIIDAAGSQVQFTYDSQDRLTSMTDQLGKTTSSIWNSKFKVISRTDPTGRVTGYTYDARGRRATSTDGAGVTISHTYDGFGNVATTTVGAHPPIQQTWDSIGRLLTLTDQMGALTSFQYDDRGNRTRKTDPRNRHTHYVFNSRGHMNSVSDRRNETLLFEHSDTGKLTRLLLAGGVETRYTYDVHDRLTAVDEPLGTTSYTYDALHRPLSRTDVHGLSVAQTYDAVGNIQSLTYPGGEQVLYTYDELNRLANMRQWLGHDTLYDYDAAGRMIWKKTVGEVSTLLSYDAAGRLLTKRAKLADASTLTAYTLTYDARGMLSAIESEQPVKPVQVARVDTQTHSPDGYLLETANGAAVTSDAEAQLASKDGGAAQFTFDSRHRLVSRTGPGVTYQYDDSGNRVSRTEGGVQRRYLYDLRGNLLAEMDGNNAVLRHYVHGQGLEQAIGPSGESYGYHSDFNGNITAITGEDGQFTHAYAYTPYGELLNRQEAFPQPFQFVGEFGVMADGNLAYMRARYYDVSTGRFISEDPKGFEGDGPNLFLYALNDPMLRVDPWGLNSDSNTGPLPQDRSMFMSIVEGATANWRHKLLTVLGMAGIGAMETTAGKIIMGGIAFGAFTGTVQAAMPTTMGGGNDGDVRNTPYFNPSAQKAH